MSLPGQQVLDSTVTYKYSVSGDSVPSQKSEIQYNQSGKIIAQSSYEWISADRKWSKKTRAENTLNAAGQQILMIAFHGDSVQDEWVPVYRSENEFDAAGNNIRVIQSGYNQQTGFWTKYYMVVFTYNNSGKWLTESHFQWENSAGEWKPGERWDRSYDDKGLMTGHLAGGWNPKINNWDFFYKEELSHDGDGRITLMTVYRKSYSTNWSFDMKLEYVYGPDHQSKEHTGFSWNPDTEEWRPISKTVDYFDDHGNQTFNYQYNNWNKDTGEWTYVFGTRHYNYYDNEGNLYLCRRYVLNPVKEWSPEWSSEYRRISSIRGNLFLSFGYERDYLTSSWKPKQKYEKFTYADGSETYEGWYSALEGTDQWACSEKIFRYYSRILTGKNEIVVDPMLVYPNPTSGIIHISGSPEPKQLTIYSLDGRKIRVIDKVTNTADLSDIPAGTYILSVQTLDGNSQRQVVIRN